MEKGTNRVTNRILRYLKDYRDEVESFVSEAVCNEYLLFSNALMIHEAFSPFDDEFMNRLNEEEMMILRSYTGTHFKEVNALLRGTWNYEENGALLPEIREKYISLAQEMHEVLKKYPGPIFSFVAYRGVDISAFFKYGITSLSDLVYMKDQYFYEEGFTSTSLISDNSYFEKCMGNIKNIQIQYLIYANKADGAMLFGNMTSYYQDENEFLIDAGSLSKIVDVQIDGEKNIAKLTAVLVPKRLWNRASSLEQASLKR